MTYNPTREEIESHDYIQIIGDGYPDAFLLNGPQALSAIQPCASCGTVHPHLRAQQATLQVHEGYLAGSGPPNNRHAPPGLDLINIDHGALLVSHRVAALLLSDKSITGFMLHDVLDQNGNVSANLYQLAVKTVIVQPDNMAVQGEVCETCGSVLSTFTRPFAIAKERMRETDFFSRNPSGISNIYVSKRVYILLKSNKIRALTLRRGNANLTGTTVH
ncbi:MAG: hypothetical protein HC896_03425 [Bacteroidales bacterium]|nr:hypothetical protein [Bacteroidales bacterium]